MTDFKLGPVTPTNILLGANSVSAIYCGSTIVWPSSNCPPYYCSTNVDPTGCTDLSSAWANCNNIVTFPSLNMSSALNLYAAWYNCSSLTSFPPNLFDTCTSTSFAYAWAECSLNEISVDGILASIDTAGQNNGALYISNNGGGWDNGCNPRTGSSPPSLTGEVAAESLVSKGWTVKLNGWVAPSNPPYNSSKVNPKYVTNLSYAWDGRFISCFPLLNTSSATNFERTWSNNSYIYYYPTFDLSNGTNFNNTWYNNPNLQEFPNFDLSNGLNFEGAWDYCHSLTSFPSTVDLSNGTNFRTSWYRCYSLTSFPALDLSSGTNFEYAWSDCTSLVSFSAINASSGTNFRLAWSNCTSMTSFGLCNLSSGTNFSDAWSYCTSLTSFPPIDLNSGLIFGRLYAYYSYGAWEGCSSLVDFPANMFDTCAATNFNGAWYGCALSQTSVDNILTSLVTSETRNGIVSLNGGTNSTPSVAGWEAVAYLTCRGWTVAVNGSIPFMASSIPQNIVDANPAIRVKWLSLKVVVNDVVAGVYYETYKPIPGATGTSFFPTITEIANKGVAIYTTDGSEPSDVYTSNGGAINGTVYGPLFYSCSFGVAVANLRWYVSTYMEYFYTGSYGPYYTRGTTYMVGSVKWAGWKQVYTTANGSLGAVTGYITMDDSEYAIWDPAQIVNGYAGKTWEPAAGGYCVLPACNEPYGCVISEDPPISITDFTNYWANCKNITAFPLLNISQGTNFTHTWDNCSLTSLAALNFSSGGDFSYAWKECQGLISFPSATFGAPATFYQAWTQCSNLTTFSPINLSNGTNFFAAWNACGSLTTFPPNAFDTCTATNFDLAWRYCPLTETSVNNILVSIDIAGQSNGTLYVDGSPPSGAGITSKANLVSRGWTVVTN